MNPPPVPAPDTAAGAEAWTRLRNEHVLAGHLRQLQLRQLLDGRSWNLDLQAGTASFDGLTTRVQLIGSESTRSGTWMWAWALPQLDTFAAGIAARAAAARQHGHSAGVPPLQNDQFDLDVADPWELAMVAVGLDRPVGIYRGPHAAGALYFTVEDLQLPPLTNAAVATAVAETLQQVDLDHQVAVPAALRSQSYRLEHDGATARAHRADETLTVCFDDLGRLTTMQVASPHG